MKIIVRKIWDKIPEGFVSINTTSRSTDFGKGLSPFFNGPVEINGETATNVENGYQGSKVYPCHLDENNQIKSEYFEWRRSVYHTKQALRYPLGKDNIPCFLLFGNKRLDYIEGKKEVYIPLYSNAVILSKAFDQLVDFVIEHKNVCLLDFDAYDHTGLTNAEIIENPNKKFGHAFCLMFLLQKIFDLKE